LNCYELAASNLGYIIPKTCTFVNPFFAKNLSFFRKLERPPVLWYNHIKYKHSGDAMEQILFVNACPREGSRTLELARHLLAGLEGQVEELPIFEENLLPLNGKTLALRDKMTAAGNFDHPIFKYARQFAAADTVVIAAPFWDLSFPSALKIWLEYVMALGVTFRYDEKGFPCGLCKANRLYYVSTAGGPVLPSHMGFDYVDALAKNYFGIGETACFSAQLLDVVGADVETILAQARQEIDDYRRKTV